jgi:hypothetical protein
VVFPQQVAGMPGHAVVNRRNCLESGHSRLSLLRREPLDENVGAREEKTMSERLYMSEDWSDNLPLLVAKSQKATGVVH